MDMIIRPVVCMRMIMAMQVMVLVLMGMFMIMRMTHFAMVVLVQMLMLVRMIVIMFVFVIALHGFCSFVDIVSSPPFYLIYQQTNEKSIKKTSFLCFINP